MGFSVRPCGAPRIDSILGCWDRGFAACFGILGLVAIAVGAALTLADRPIVRLMSGVR